MRVAAMARSSEEQQQFARRRGRAAAVRTHIPVRERSGPTVPAAYGVQIEGEKGDPREELTVSSSACSGRVGVDWSDGIDYNLVAAS